MIASLELTEDQMVQELAEIQKLARAIFEAGAVHPYVEHDHEQATMRLLKKMSWLTKQGDVM